MVLRLVPRTPLAATYSSSIAVRDRDHRLLRLTLSDDDKYRLWTPLGGISPNLVAAMLIHEDRHFYRHFAVNPLSLLRAIYVTYVSRERRVGGSTIPMQLARLHYRIKSRSLRGKASQVLHAIYLELRYPKAELLEAYLNLVPFGQNIEGVAAASQIYFGKPIGKLGLPEALTLAVIPQSPLRRGAVVRGVESEAMADSPALASQALLRARGALYEKWLAAHPGEKRDEALMKLPITLRDTHDLPFRAPHFVETVLTQARGDVAPSSPRPSRATTTRAANEVITTLELPLQQLVEKQIKGYVARNRRIGITNAVAMLVDSRDMSVRAAVGSGLPTRADVILQRSTVPRLPAALQWLHGLGLRGADLWFVSLTDHNRDNVASMPRMRDVVPTVREAMAWARAHDFDVRSLHIPRCLLGDDHVHVFDPAAQGVRVISPDARFDLRDSRLTGSVHVPACAGCAFEARCPGIRPDYLERYGAEEFTAVR
jgi:hypothetical protein